MFPPPKLALASTIRQRALLGGAAFVAVVFFTISLQRYHLLLWTGIILLPSHLPPPPPVHDRAGFNHGYNESVKGVFNGTWDWRRDSRTLTLDSEQCDAAFPGLFLEVDRAVQHRAQRKITLADLDAVSKKETGYFRVMIYDQEVSSAAPFPCADECQLLTVDATAVHHRGECRGQYARAGDAARAAAGTADGARAATRH